MSDWQALLLAGKEVDRGQPQESYTPRNWTLIGGVSLLERAVEANTLGAKRTAVILPKLEETLWSQSTLARSCTPVFLERPTRGALCTAVLGLDLFELDLPLAISSGDSFTNWPATQIVETFLRGKADAGTVILRSSNEDLSYVRVTRSGRAIELAEKRRVSEFATSGFFIFRQASDFLDAAEWVLSSNMATNGRFYLSAALNFAIMRGKEVAVLQLPAERSYFRFDGKAGITAFKGGEW